MLVLGFSGIHNGGYYSEHYGLRFVGHDAAVALVRDGEILFAAEEERFSRQKHTSSFPKGALEAALHATGLQTQDINAVAYPWVVTARKFLHMNLNHMHRVPLLDGPGLAIAGLRVIRDLMSPRRIGELFATELGTSLPPRSWTTEDDRACRFSFAGVSSPPNTKQESMPCRRRFSKLRLERENPSFWFV